MLSGVFYAAVGLLLVAGAQKALDPKPLVRALRSVSAPLPASVVRVIALAEVGVAVHALVTGSGLLVAASYGAFTGFVLVARARGGVLASCGCFGKADTPPTVPHALVTAGFAAASVPGGDGLGPALLVTSVAVAVTAYLVMALLPLVSPRAIASSSTRRALPVVGP